MRPGGRSCYCSSQRGLTLDRPTGRLDSARRLALARSWRLAAPAGRRRGRAPRTVVDPGGEPRCASTSGRRALFKFAGHEHEVVAPALDGRDRGRRRRPRALVRDARRSTRPRCAVTGEGEPADDVPKVQEAMRGPQGARRGAVPADRLPVAQGVGPRGRRRASTSSQVDGRPRRCTASRSALTLPVRVETRGRTRSTATGRRRIRQTDFGIKPVSVARGGEGEERARGRVPLRGLASDTVDCAATRQGRPLAGGSVPIIRASSLEEVRRCLRSGRLWAIREVTRARIRSLPEMARRDARCVEVFGSNTFDADAMKEKLPKAVFESLQETIRRGQRLDPAIANEVAHAVKEWALDEGRHALLPLVPAADRPHRREARRLPDLRRRRRADGALQRRAAHPERARRLELPVGRHAHAPSRRAATRPGIPSSPIFIVDGPNGKTLCVPSVFISYHGDALDNKTPLLRSMEYLSEQRARRPAPVRRHDLHARGAHPRARAGVLPDRPGVLRAAARPRGRRPHAGRAPSRPRARSSRTTTSAASRTASWPSCRRRRTSCTSSASPSRRATTRWRPASTRRRRSSRRPTSPPTTTRS